jgi:general secretion pathway protein E
MTYEDPVENKIPGLSQSQVRADINYTFAAGLRAGLRQDPDVIMVGEIRDDETLEMAMESAMT